MYRLVTGTVMTVVTIQKIKYYIKSMKVKKTTLKSLAHLYSHPSAVLFRSIELATIYNNTRQIKFRQPSLDIGCGDGKITKLLFDSRFTYGVDNGEAKDVQDAIDNKIYGKVFLESAEKMSLPDASVNFVFSNCVLEHIPNNKAVLKEVSRILKKGGDFIFTVPSHNYPDFLYLTNKFASIGLGFLSRMYKYRRNKMLNQFHCYRVDDWQKKLAKYGLKIVKSQYYVSKTTLMLWDKMALQIFMMRPIFGKKTEKMVMRRFRKQIIKAYSWDMQNKVQAGAGLFIHCRKIN